MIRIPNRTAARLASASGRALRDLEILSVANLSEHPGEDEGSLSAQTLVIEFLQFHTSKLKIYTKKMIKASALNVYCLIL